MIGIVDLVTQPVRLLGRTLQAPDTDDLLPGLDLAGVEAVELEPLRGMPVPAWLVYLAPTADVLLLDPCEPAADGRTRFMVQGAHHRIAGHPRYKRLRTAVVDDPALSTRLVACGFREREGKIMPRVLLSGENDVSASEDPEDARPPTAKIDPGPPPGVR